ncbi:hypothetical protein BG000_008671 [Podila horticola]|nr:hypothetical protein BG000_008671 [Podila horticola]
MNPRSKFALQQNKPLEELDSNTYVDPDLATGGTIMPKLGNETAKAELGRATWKLLHTMASRYPEKPKPDERAAMKQWIMLLSRLYPCGEW